MSLNWCKPFPVFIQSFWATTQAFLGEPVRNAVAFECRACPPAPREVTLHGWGPLRRTRAFPLWLIRPLLSSVTPTRQCHLSLRPSSALALSWDRPPFFAPTLLTEGPRRSPLQPPAQRRGYWEAAEKAFHRSITEQRRALISLRLRPPGTRLVRLRSPPGGERFLSRLQKGLCKRAKSAQHNYW